MCDREHLQPVRHISFSPDVVGDKEMRDEACVRLSYHVF